MGISRAPLNVRYFLYGLWVPAVLIARDEQGRP